MIKRMMIAAGVAAALVSPALAAQDTVSCEAMLKRVDEIVAQGQPDEATKKQVEEAKAKAAEQLKAGDEEGCKATATQILEALAG